MCLKLLREGDFGSLAKETKYSLISSSLTCSGSWLK